MGASVIKSCPSVDIVASRRVIKMRVWMKRVVGKSVYSCVVGRGDRVDMLVMSRVIRWKDSKKKFTFKNQIEGYLQN